jgi:hypothetical protein
MAIHLPPLNATARVHMSGNAGAGTTQQGIRVFVQGPTAANFTQTDLQSIASGFASTVAGSPLVALAICQSSFWHWTVCEVFSTDGNGLYASAPVSIVGSGAASINPPQCAVCISWKSSGINWRGGRPRTYIPAIPTTALATGGSAALASTYATQVKAQGNQFILSSNAIAVTGGPIKVGTISYYNSVVNPTPPHLRTTPVFFPYLSCVVHDRLDSQRRRSGKESAFAVT